MRARLARTRAYRAVTGAWSEPAAIACSGGVDSTALLLVATEALRRGKVGRFTVLHVDHRTREDSARDAEFVAALCNELSIPFVSLRVDAAGSVPGRSDEDVWRERRYKTLLKAAVDHGLRYIVTAHTQDDQVETILMQLFAGAARWGMQTSTFIDEPSDVSILRPLIDTKRTDLEEVLAIAGITPLIDPSNVDTRFRRNAVRHELVPVLSRVVPGFERPLLRTAAIHRRDAEYCDDQARDAFSSMVVARHDGFVGVDRTALREAHPSISSRVVRLAAIEVAQVAESRELTFERLEAVVRAASGRTGAVIELPYGVRVDIYRTLVAVQRSG